MNIKIRQFNLIMNHKNIWNNISWFTKLVEFNLRIKISDFWKNMKQNYSWKRILALILSSTFWKSLNNYYFFHKIKSIKRLQYNLKWINKSTLNLLFFLLSLEFVDLVLSFFESIPIWIFLIEFVFVVS